LNKLIGLEEVLIHCECYFINDIDNIKEKNIFQCLKDFAFVNYEDDQLIQCFPENLKAENYMILIICLRKLINNLEDKKNAEDEDNKWDPYVHDLWSENKLKHLSDIAEGTTFDIVFNPITGLYGFDNEVYEEEDSDELAEDISISVPNENVPLVTQHSSLNDELSNLAAELTPEDIIDYLKSLKLIGNYTEEFLKLEVDGITMFYSIEEDSLESLGVDIKRDRLKIKVQFERWLKSKKKLS
jgi:hypothetical protein